MYNRPNIIAYMNECWLVLVREYNELHTTRFNDFYYRGDQAAGKVFYPSPYFPAGEKTIGGMADTCRYAIAGLCTLVRYPNGNFPPSDAPIQRQIDAVLSIPFINSNPQVVAFINEYAKKFVNIAEIVDNANSPRVAGKQ